MSTVSPFKPVIARILHSNQRRQCAYLRSSLLRDMAIETYPRIKESRSTYQQYLQSELWQQHIRPAIWARSGGHCERCGSDAAWAVHHLSYFRHPYPWLNDLQLVCRACHEYLHGFTTLDPADLPVDPWLPEFEED